MSGNMQSNYLKTSGYVLRRTNYGEADRILNIITPIGKISAIAKGARREKSKLAGGIEMFSLVDLNIHKGRGEIGIITSAKMVRFYSEIMKDLNLMEIGSSFLKKIDRVAGDSETEDYFNLVHQSLDALNTKGDARLVEAWFLLNIARIMGEEINLYRDNNDKKLEAGRRYDWDYMEACFVNKDNGRFGEDEIKVLRLMMTNKMNIIKKIKLNDEIVGKVFELVRGTCKI